MAKTDIAGTVEDLTCAVGLGSPGEGQKEDRADPESSRSRPRSPPCKSPESSQRPRKTHRPSRSRQESPLIKATIA